MPWICPIFKVNPILLNGLLVVRLEFYTQILETYLEMVLLRFMWVREMLVQPT